MVDTADYHQNNPSPESYVGRVMDTVMVYTIGRELGQIMVINFYGRRI
jgi:hypothetical protein